MTVSTMIQKAIDPLVTKSSANAGVWNNLLFVGCVAINSVVQCLGIAKNTEIPAEQKKFLIPQEALDGAFKVASNIPLVWAADKFISQPLAKNLLKEMQKDAALLGKTNANEQLLKVASGVGMGVTLLAGTASYSLITPFFRNTMANLFDKKAKKDDVKVNTDHLMQETPAALSLGDSTRNSAGIGQVSSAFVAFERGPVPNPQKQQIAASKPLVKPSAVNFRASSLRI